MNDGGHETFPLVCAECGNRARVMVPKMVIKALEVEAPELSRKWAQPKCEVCGVEGAEAHHWAPWALFGNESDRWPRSFLCPPCHARWHRMVTPNISAQD